MNGLINKILNLYNLTPIKIYPPQHGYRNKCYRIVDITNKEYNLILYKNEPKIVSRIRNANRVSDYLAMKGLHTRQTVRYLNKSIICIGFEDLQPIHQRFYTCLYNYLPGITIPWEGYTMKHIKLLGKTLSDMHCALEKLSQESLPNVINECQILLYEMRAYFANDGVIKAMKNKLNITLNKDIFAYFEKLMSVKFNDMFQPLHMDFVRSNILFCHSGRLKGDPESRAYNNSIILDPRFNWDDTEWGLSISGILDFEKVAYGPKIFDIARTLAFLLVDCKYKTEDKIVKYFLYSGYDKRGSIKLPDIKYLNQLISLFLFYDFYKFLKHNPYDHLNENEHYLRTIRLLEKSSSIVGI